MSNHIMEGEGRLAQADIIREQLVRCDAVAGGPRSSNLLENFDNEVMDNTHREFAISVHPVQIGSKLWLIEELGRHCDLSASSLVMLGAWYGILPLIINWRLAEPPRQMVCIDSDPTVCEAGARMIGSLYAISSTAAQMRWSWTTSSLDTRYPPVVINTICEHLLDFHRIGGRVYRAVSWLSCKTTTILSALITSTASSSTEQFRQQCPLSELLYEGILHFPELDRFMLIGRR